MAEINNNGSDLVITRIFDAPKEIVWRAWTEPEQIKRWWGPGNFTSPHYEMDFRLGGKYLGCMRSPDGKDYWSTGVYKEIIPFEKIVCTDSFADAQGKVISGAEYGMEGMPLEFLMTILFEEQNGKTKLTIIHSGFPEGEMKNSANSGWNESLDKLEQAVTEPHLKG